MEVFFWSKRCGTDTRKKNLGKRISERIAENMKWSVMNEINNDPVKGLGELWGKISKESPGLDRIFWKESSGKNLGGLSKNLEGEGGRDDDDDEEEETAEAEEEAEEEEGGGGGGKQVLNIELRDEGHLQQRYKTKGKRETQMNGI